MATAREYFIETLEEEVPKFVKVYKALPADKLDYTPHPKNRTASGIATAMIHEAEVINRFLTEGDVDMMSINWAAQFAGPDEMAVATEEALHAAIATAKGMSESEWDSSAAMKSGDKVTWPSTRGDLAWGMLFDLIHHRGQLTMYLRPMGGKIPAIYGPSGDESM